MPASLMSLFPQAQAVMEGLAWSMKTNIAMTEMASQMIGFGFSCHNAAVKIGFDTAANCLPASEDTPDSNMFREISEIYRDGALNLSECLEKSLISGMDRYKQHRQGEVEFLEMFTQEPPAQKWSMAFSEEDVLLDLPGMRLIDVSWDTPHEFDNYTVVFAPRAGHHSNIGERTALYLRDQGLTRMAIVEQKCADDIPMYADGVRHYENFDGQVSQYRSILTHLKERTGYAPHVVAVCQPGPLLISTLILYPELARTFGSAGSPMHTEGEEGFLTDFSRQMGKDYIDRLINFFSSKVGPTKIGAGREIYDGRLQVLGFYILGIEQHARNLKKILVDLQEGDKESAQRQMQFYNWYNYALHFPAGFIRDTYKKIFVENALINGTLTIHGRPVRLENYPAHVPIWALGGSRDNIAPPQQAIGHLEFITSVPESRKISAVADAGHMGLFRSRRVLRDHYGDIADFMKSNSDAADKSGYIEKMAFEA